jgi:hypothetical protein
MYQYDTRVYDFSRMERRKGVAVKFHTFYPGWGKDVGSVSILILFWISMVVPNKG